MDGQPRRASRPLPAARLVLRVLVALVALVALDAVAAAYLRPEQAYDDAWRLPRERSMAALPGFIHHIESVTGDPRRPVVVFLGASPTWGETNRDRHDTYPARFQQVAAARGRPLRAFNLGANGQLVADQYFLGTRIAGSADLIVVQLTYHTFNPRSRIDGAQRYPELPGILSAEVPATVAGVLGIDATRTPDATGAARRTLDARWRLFRERDELTTKALGGSPKDQALRRWQELTGSKPPAKPEDPAAADAAEEVVPFDALDPSRQTRAVERWAEFGRFTLQPDDSELRMLDLLCARLASSHARAVVCMSPLNLRALTAFELLDRAGYDANVALIRRTVERHGLRFVDWNARGSALPGRAFADMNHFTDDGAGLFARRLFDRLGALLDDSSGSAGTR